MLPLGQIIKCHGLKFHSYAEDMQMNFFAQPNSVFPSTSLTSYLHDLKVWMAQNLLKGSSDAKFTFQVV